MSSQVSYKVLQSPDDARWPRGSTLSLREVATTVGSNIWELSMLSRQSSEIAQRGFRFQVSDFEAVAE